MSLIPLASFAQLDKEQLHNNFLERTIQYYYTSTNSSHNFKSAFLILKDSLPNNLKTKYSSFKVAYVTKSEAIKQISRTKDKVGNLDWISTKWLSQDTCDILIGSWSITVEKNNVNFGAACGGTFGYIPTSRFIYNSLTKQWSQITSSEIIKERLKEREKMVDD